MKSPDEMNRAREREGERLEGPQGVSVDDQRSFLDNWANNASLHLNVTTLV